MLNRAVDHHAAELLCLDQVQIHAHVDRLRKQFLHALLTEQLTELHQRRGIAGQAIPVVRAAQEELLPRRIAPTLQHRLIGLVKSVFHSDNR